MQKLEIDAPARDEKNPLTGVQDEASVLRDLHSASGIFLSFVFAGHALATRWYFLNLPADMTFASTTLIAKPLSYVFFPYYIALGTAGAFHMMFGMSRVLRYYGGSVQYRTNTTAFKVASGVACAAVASAVLAIGGVYYPIVIPRIAEYAVKLKYLTYGAVDPAGIVGSYEEYAAAATV